MKGYTDTYIVLPGIVYGPPHGILADAGVQNPTNLALTGYIKASFERRAAGIVGKGKNFISHVDVTEGETSCIFRELSFFYLLRSRRPR
jgi:hypothetical protein